MFIKQISVFLENNSGRLARATEVLADVKIDIRALSIADTTDFGILRLIVNDPDKAYLALKEAGFTVMTTSVIAIAIDDKSGGLHHCLQILSAANIGIEYMYAFCGKAIDKAIVVIRADDNEKAQIVLEKNDMPVLPFEKVEEI